ncbi:MAG TPA: endonuclease/exonuclease/phosphatase family protein [Actinomycetota bacterium]|nr:endonuclease/exonuclease/phosphatase family protein [Actinomycetota bacterium]
MRATRVRAGRLALFVVLLLPPFADATANAGIRAAPAPVTLRVAEFNIEYGGTHVSFGKVVQAIRRGGADVVAIEEGYGHMPRLARRLGWPSYSVRTQVVSKYPVIDPPGANGRYVLVEIAPGAVVAIENVHLPSNPYGPYWTRSRPRSEVVALERRRRLPAIRPYLQTARKLVASGIPVFLAGDFNAPSWRDWTPEMVGARPQIRYPVRWPVSLAVERAGFVDSYRSVYPDPMAHPGLTWWAARPHLPGWNPGPHAPQDRIDFVYAAGEATATGSLIVGEPGAPDVDVAVRPWPSDHRSVVSTFTVTPGVPPLFVAVERRLIATGDELRVSFHASGRPGEGVAIVPAAGDPATDVIASRPTGGATDGALAFDTDSLAPGSYDAVLVDGTGAELSRIPFWVEEPGAEPELSTSKPVYAVGEGIDVSWRNAPGERWDWVGIYHRGANPRKASYLLWAYTDASVEGSITLDASASGPWPLPAGRYSVYLLRDDGYTALARADFEVG